MGPGRIDAKRKLVLMGALVAAFSLTAAAGQKPASIDEALSGLGSRDEKAVNEASKFLVSHEKAARPLLHQAARDWTRVPLLRLRIVRLLGDIGDHGSVDVLRESLMPSEGEKAEESAGVREEIIFTLARLEREKGLRTFRHIYEYFRTGRENSPRVKAAIVSVLPALPQHAETSKGIIALLLRDRDENVREWAMLSFDKLSQPAPRTSAGVLGRRYGLPGEVNTADFAPKTEKVIVGGSELHVTAGDKAVIEGLQEIARGENPGLRKTASYLLARFKNLSN